MIEKLPVIVLENEKIDSIRDTELLGIYCFLQYQLSSSKDDLSITDLYNAANRQFSIKESYFLSMLSKLKDLKLLKIY